MILYTCFMGTSFGSVPGRVAHPCGRAAKALDDGSTIAGSGRIVAWADAQLSR